MSEKKELNITVLMDWLEGKLDAAEAAAVAQTVAQEPSLQTTVEWLRQFLHLSTDTVLATPDPTIHKRATEHFRAHARGKQARGKERPGIWQTLVGLLTSDSWQRLSLATVRNVNLHTVPRQLIYTTPAADVALNIQARDEQLDLAGQVFPLDEEETAPYTVQLLQMDQELGLSTTDPVGKFSFPSLAEGKYELVLTADAHEIVIESLELALSKAP
jgi:hypothetical protein